jgi:hypothetical protein
MGYHFSPQGGLVPLIRPRLLVEAARTGARLYRRGRDLRGAVAGAADLPPQEIPRRLAEVEQICEELRRLRSPAYRPGKHVQVLSALLAEAAQTKASGSEALRRAM